MSKIKISNIEENNNNFKFTIENINVSLANALRRVIISDIPCLVFKTQPYNENNVTIHINRSRLNNELIKQRIGCIPIHISDIEDFMYNDYIVELDVENKSNALIYATTENFKIKNTKLNKYLESSEVKKIFPPDPISGDFIDILRLRPQISDNIEPDHIKLEATLTISNANEDGMYNVVSTCSYGNTKDVAKINEIWEIKHEELKSKNLSKEEIDFMKKDWLLLDAKRIFVEDSFDFVIETIGIYTNYKIMELASTIIMKKLLIFLDNIKMDQDLIKDANDTMDNCYLIILKNEDYTIGKIIEHHLYLKYFSEKKELNFVGFLKRHPHDTDSFIKISFKNIITKDEIIVMLEECVNNNIIEFKYIRDYFSEK